MIFGILLWLYFLFSSVAQSCPALWDPMDGSSPGFPVHHQLPELAQTHVHWVGDAVQPSHPLLSSSPPAFNLSQHQVIFQWLSSLHQEAKVLEFQLQHQHISCYSQFMLHKCRMLTVPGIHGSGLMLLRLGTCSALCVLCALEYAFPSFSPLYLLNLCSSSQVQMASFRKVPLITVQIEFRAPESSCSYPE